ncbi:40S ribosomal protein S24e [Trypanosoma conorhini]|uniref:40S ribosomal protein S24e n=1 Tax=Trypanosoma conorhini TaxID=83891 RepID=A0A3R7L7Z2_9TRYP|nr:40S ribosomal protein S24e [Trypanosoma conorhini]RNF22907.1 40S ribosomal protein S24e [Trypanosoma conorhini]
MRLNVNQCFPDPLSRQWPATHHPVLCECRQLYVLVSICCCVPSAHLLVMHDGGSNSTVTSMPKGPTYLELRITEQTRREAFCGFLMRAESATMASVPPGFAEDHRQVTVVCLQELSAASPQVLSALMDVLVFGLLRVGNTVKRVPSLRIVAFCDARAYAAALPECVLDAFALSTYMSALAMESAAVIQSADTQSSNVVNKRHMLEVMLSPDGDDLVETVTLAGEVSRYLRHLLVVLRSAMLVHSAPGSYVPTRVPRMLRLLKVFALLFAPAAQDGLGKLPLALRSTSFTTQRASAVAPITDFAHVVVSPAHVMCLLCPMVAHLFSVRRAMVAASLGPGAEGKESSLLLASDEEAGAAVTLWDARAVLWISVSGGTHAEVTFTGDETLRLGLSTTRDIARALRSIHEEWLSYPECRELVRATVLKHSAPPKG